MLLIHGARSCLAHLNRSQDRLGAWIEQLTARMHPNKATVALANKMARIAWRLLQSSDAVYVGRAAALPAG